MSYESPIEMFTEQVSDYWSKKTDDLVMKAVMNVGVYVDKDELVKALAYDRDQYEKGFHDGIMANKWTLTTERLPELGQEVIASCCDRAEETYVEKCVYADIFNGAKFWCDAGWIKTETVIAWMPLPEPYEEEENG